MLPVTRAPPVGATTPKDEKVPTNERTSIAKTPTFWNTVKTTVVQTQAALSNTLKTEKKKNAEANVLLQEIRALLVRHQTFLVNEIEIRSIDFFSRIPVVNHLLGSTELVFSKPSAAMQLTAVNELIKVINNTAMPANERREHFIKRWKTTSKFVMVPDSLSFSRSIGQKLAEDINNVLSPPSMDNVVVPKNSNARL